MKSGGGQTVLIIQRRVFQERGAFAIDKKLDTIHKFVNSEYGIALRLGASALERLAAITKSPDDAKQAKLARLMADDHDRKQKEIDADNSRR